MSRRAAGVTFCAIAAFLFGLRYVVAAQLFGGMHPGAIDTNTLDLYLSYAGTPLLTASTVALIAGIVFLIFAEIDDFRRRDK
jgi:hypothetical protein